MAISVAKQAQAVAAVQHNVALYMAPPSVVMTRQLVDQYLHTLQERGRQIQTIRIYRRSLLDLYDFLPASKEITPTVLEDWRTALKAKGYSHNTINVRLTAANGFMRYCGVAELAARHEVGLSAAVSPPLTRSEYLRLLSTVCRTGKRQDYLLIKVFGSMDISMRELSLLTVEACEVGKIHVNEERTIRIPPPLGQELLEYAGSCNRTSGMVFATRNGTPLDRSNIARAIRDLAIEAGIDPEKCAPGALHRLYLATREEIEEKIQPICVRTYDDMLATEQVLVSWQDTENDRKE